VRGDEGTAVARWVRKASVSAFFLQARFLQAGHVTWLMYRMTAIIVVSPVLTSAGCAHHQPVLRLPALQTGHPAFAATLAAYSGTTVVSGNRVEILLNGDAIFPAKLRAIRSARKTINYAQYVFDEGEPSEDVVRALEERCRAGVTVNVLLDGAGTLTMPDAYRQRMLQAGCRIESFRIIPQQ